MRLFAPEELGAAQLCAAQGGQALREVSPDKAHLLDLDAPRLAETARRLGVRMVLIHRRGEPDQRIELVGGPLRRALKECRGASEVKIEAAP